MKNCQIETGLLISEIIKCNSDPELSKHFIRYIINMIVNEGYFKSSIFKQLIKLAESDSLIKNDPNVEYDETANN